MSIWSIVALVLTVLSVIGELFTSGIVVRCYMYMRAVRAAFDVYSNMGHPMQQADALPNKSWALMNEHGEPMPTERHHAAWTEPDEPPLPV